MKRPSLTILAFCLFAFQVFTFLPLKAEPVGKQAALYTAQAYMLAKGKTLSSNPSSRKGTKDFSQAEQDYYYVFNAGDDGGYVIVSGDDRTEPILGYVEHGTFDPDNIPENMRSWLQGYADQIKYIVDNDIDPNSPLLKRRNKIRGTKHSVSELLTTRWNQGHPYNLTCPNYYTDQDNDEHRYPATGCTATAMAQVMNFYKYPDKLKAQIPALTNTYWTRDGTQKNVTTPAIPRNTPIDWENMRDTYDCWDEHQHTAQDTAVANLMLYCGQSVNMGYGPSSGANFSAEAYTKYFGFDDSAFVGERPDYSIDEWFDMLYNEIAQGYPVLFSGFSSGGGHAFVLDGFDGDNLFHLNWGWGGGSNGWFLVGILNPGDNSGIGASSSSDGYSMGQRALFSLRLPDNVKADAMTALTINDVEITGTSIKGNWINWTGSTGTFNTAIVKLNDDGTLSPVGTTQTISSMGVNTYQTKTFNINKKLSEGTYKLSPASKLSSSKTWRTKYNMRNEYIEAVVDADGVPTLSFKNPVVDISIENIEFPGTRIVNTQQEVRVTFRNNGDEYYQEVHFFASKSNDKVYTNNRSMVAVRQGETVDVSYFFTPYETGTYNLWFCTGSDGSGQVGQGTMEVVDASDAEKANLTASNFTISNAVSGTVYGKRLAGKVSIRNNASTDFHGQIRFQLWTYRQGEDYVYSGPSQTVSLDLAASKTASVNFDFDNLSTDLTYYFPIYYVNQDGELNGAGIWEHSYTVNSGVLSWTKTGVISGKAYSASMTAASTACGLYADCNNFTRLTPNSNKNTIYAFAPGMDVPSSLDNSNAVSGNHASHINFVKEKPFYVSVNFVADEATFTYTFPTTEDGSGWHAFTMPFEADEITVDGSPVALDDPLNHFWIYEFAAQGDNGEVIFEPATVLRSGSSYIIAGDAQMAGRDVVFHSTDVPFYKTGSDKLVVTSQHYKFQGTTLGPSVKDCYVLNADGTAFEYTTTNKTLAGLVPYFTTTLPEEQRLPSIQLPEVPKEGQVQDGHRYYQFAIEAIRDGNVIQLSEFDLIDKNGNEISPLTLYATTGTGFDNEGLENLFDNNTDTKFCGLFNAGTTLYIYIDAGRLVELSGYRITTANDTETYPGRNPVTWSLLGSNTKSEQPDDDVWMLLDRRVNDNTIGAANYTPFDFTFTYPQPTPTYTVTATATEGGSITLSATEVEQGSDVTITITTNEDYELASLFVAGRDVAAEVENNQYVIRNITENIEVRAVFRATIATIVMSNDGERTYCSDRDLDFSQSSNFCAYIASGYYPESGWVLLTRVLEVPAGTGIVVRGEKGTYKVPFGHSTAYYLNLLVGNVEQTTVEPTEGDKVNLYLTTGDNGLGFYRFNTSIVMEKNSARLQLPANVLPSNRRSVLIFYEEDADAIRDIIPVTPTYNAVYDLQGRKVGTQLDAATHGLYIVNGKKVIR